ncbi:MAG: dihydrolipoyl dehydrogenase [Clostridiales bacterium]|nr:dihydrolipoyl dehydrogenase [Clostridiales bacterium]
MQDKYDLIVIGSGSGGYVAAIKAAKLGKRTAIIEKRDIGGTCLNRGCIPTKTLMHSTNFLSEAKYMEKVGISFTDLKIDYDKLSERKDEVVSKIRRGIQGLLMANGITIYEGSAQIVDSNLVRIKTGEEDIDVKADNILIATGSVPAIPGIEGVNFENVVNSDDLLSGEIKQYKKLLIIGGGVIGLEFATIYRNMGCEVEIIEAMDRLLPGMDKEISQSIAMGLKRKGVTIHTGARVDRIGEGGSYGLVCEFTQKSKPQITEAEAILLSVGRRPNTKELFAQGFSLDMEGHHIKVDDEFRTSIPSIYAIGDVIRGRQLAHAASAQGIVAVERICGLSPSVDLDVIPSCIYTNPEIATVGMNEADAIAEGYQVKVGKYPMLGNGKTILSMGERGFIKLICEEKDGRLLGAVLMCDRATDIIGELSMAISKKLTYKDLASIIRPHPTYEEGITEAAEDIEGMAIHLMPKRSLS